MDEVEQIITQTVDANGGRTSWDTVRDELDFRQQTMMPKAMKSLKAKGIIQAQSRVVNAKPIFEVFRIGTTPSPSTPSGGDA